MRDGEGPAHWRICASYWPRPAPGELLHHLQQHYRTYALRLAKEARGGHPRVYDGV